MLLLFALFVLFYTDGNIGIIIRTLIVICVSICSMDWVGVLVVILDVI